MNRSLSCWWRVIVVGLCFVALASKSASAGHPKARHPNVRGPIEVGMVALTATPERYEGKLVRTHGFLCLEFEGDAVYLHEEDYRYGLTKNSLALRMSKLQREQFKALSLRYVLVEGIVFSKGIESSDRWGGAIGKITRLEAWPVDRGKEAIGQISSVTIAGPGTLLGATGKGTMTLTVGYMKESSAAWVGSLLGHEGQHYLNRGKYSGKNLWRDEQSAGKMQLGIGNKIGFKSYESRYLGNWIDDRNHAAMQQHMLQGLRGD